MYEEKKFTFPEMKGISQKQLEAHLGLYAGYVKNVNALTQKIEELKGDSEKNALALSEVKRRFAFEWDGMRLHEYYFENIGAGGAVPEAFTQLVTQQWGNFENWKNEFASMGLMRGIGWVLCVLDEKTNIAFNVWVGDHEVGHLAGARVLLAMDVWEHAYLLDYLPSERKKYIDAFMENIAWEAVVKRLA